MLAASSDDDFSVLVFFYNLNFDIAENQFSQFRVSIKFSKKISKSRSIYYDICVLILAKIYFHSFLSVYNFRNPDQLIMTFASKI